MNKNFWAYFHTQFLGAFNDNLFKNGFIMFVTFSGAMAFGFTTKEVVTWANAFFILPYFLFSAIAGQLADKYDKSLLIRHIKLAEVFIMLMAAYWFINTSTECLLIVLFLMGAQSAFFSPIKYSILPKLLGQDELIKGNGYVEMSTFLAILIGSLVGGQIISLTGQPLELTLVSRWVVGSCLVALSVLGYVAARSIEPLKVTHPELKFNYNLIGETLRLIQYTRHKPVVFHYSMANSWFWFIGAGIITLLPLFTHNTLNASKDVANFFMALFSVGIALGSLCCNKLSSNHAATGLIPIGAAGLCLFIALFAGIGALLPTPQETQTLSVFLLAPANWLLMISLVMMAFSGGLYIVPLYAGIQQKSESELLARVIAGFNILSAVMMVSSGVLIDQLFDLNLSEGGIFGVFVVLNVIFHIWLLRSEKEFIHRLKRWFKIKLGINVG